MKTAASGSEGLPDLRRASRYSRRTVIALAEIGSRRDLKNFVPRISMELSFRSTSLSFRRTISPKRRPAQYASTNIVYNMSGRNLGRRPGYERAVSSNSATCSSLYM